MGFFMSQGMKVKLMVCKDSTQNEQEMLGNKNFYKKNVNSQNETVFSVEFCRGYHGYWSRPKATFVFFSYS
jgi:hypothetical protein